MRKLADYAMMLRDYRLAHATFEILCQDFKNDKAWRHYAGANEMAAVSLLMATGSNQKIRIEGIDQYLETAYYSYVTRVGAPYNALRTLVLGVELLKMRGGNALDDAARWASRILDDRLVGPVGHVLLMERIGASFNERRKIGGLEGIDRHRKAAFWNMLAADAWLRLEKASQAEKCLEEAMRLYQLSEKENHVEFDGMSNFLFTLQEAVAANRGGVHHIDGEDLLGDEVVEPMQEEHEQLKPLPAFGHRKSVSTNLPPPLQTAAKDPLGALPTAYDDKSAVPPSPHAPDAPPMSPNTDARARRDDGFE